MPIILKENECVHCPSYDEFVVAIKHINKYSRNKFDNAEWYSHKNAIVLYNDGYASLSFAEEENSRVYSFSEFMQEDKKEEKTYTQKEVDAIIAETRQQTIDEIIDRLETLNAQVLNIPENIRTSTSRCKNCGRFINKTIGCQYCI